MNFTKLFQEKQFAFLPYVCLGYPSLEQSVELCRALEPFADGFELGVPFSEHVADGAVLQKTTQAALDAGFKTEMTFEAVRKIRRFSQKPIALLTYCNPVIAFGEKRFAKKAKEAGVDAIMAPDAPLEEKDFFKDARSEGIETVLFVAPTTPEKRAALIAKSAQGFVYAIAVKGVTGARAGFTENVGQLVSKIPGKPVVVGFGISTPEQVKGAKKAGARGVIVGSALAAAYMEGGKGAAVSLAEKLQKACGETERPADG